MAKADEWTVFIFNKVGRITEHVPFRHENQAREYAAVVVKKADVYRVELSYDENKD